MGTSVKTLSRFMSLHQRDLLKSGASMMELGAQQLFCTAPEHVRAFIEYFSSKDPALKQAALYTQAELEKCAHNGLLGPLMIACGFEYRALDIFEAENTILFDQNIHTPPDELCNRFDLVTNFGTTEHVLNQLGSMKTMHELTKPGGLMYHDLPLTGYHNHGYFSYNPLLFKQLADANQYKIIFQHYSKGGAPTPTPGFMVENGYPDSGYFDYGIEFILQKTSLAPFRMPLETSTSLGLSKTLWGDASPYGDNDFSNQSGSAPSILMSLAQVSGWDLQRELFRRYRRKAARLMNLRR